MISVLQQARQMGLTDEDLCGGSDGSASILLANLANVATIMGRYERAGAAGAWHEARLELAQVIDDMKARKRVQELLNSPSPPRVAGPPHHI